VLVCFQNLVDKSLVRRKGRGGRKEGGREGGKGGEDVQCREKNGEVKQGGSEQWETLFFVSLRLTNS